MSTTLGSNESKDSSKREYTQTNPRYRGYCQIHYTIGDEEQFRDAVPNLNSREMGRKVKAKRMSSSLNPRTQISFYKKLNPRSRDNTFKYLFHGFKKGIFVQYRDGQLTCFQPFSKYNYYQDWGNRIKPNRTTMENLLRESQRMSGRSYNPRRVQRDQCQWIQNGCLLRYEHPPREGDSNVDCLEDMLLSLSQEREVPDMEFFLNRHDFPRLKKDLSHPYSDFLGKSVPINHYGDAKYCPILSMCSGDDYADVPIPTWDDWIRVNPDAKFCSTYLNRKDKAYAVDYVDWHDKKDQAVFRGASTGQGVTPETNMRLKLALMSRTDDRIDAGITNFNWRPRVVRNDDDFAYLDIPVPLEGLEEQPRLSAREQSGYKYVIDIDGHSCAFRLVSELAYGSVILLAKGKHKLWVTNALVDGEHYVGIKPDLSDLSEKLEWCQNHQTECKQIAANARKFFLKYCTRDSILDHLQSVLVKLSNQTGQYSYNRVTALNVLTSLEKRTLGISIPPVTTSEGEILKESRSTTIVKTERGILKRTKVTEKEAEARHDAFVSLVLREVTCTQLSKCLAQSGSLSLWEYIPGPTLAELVKGGICRPALEDLTLQVCGILTTLQDTCNFVHNDLYPWNIICSNPRDIIEYSTSRGKWQSRGLLHISLVDYGKSTLVHDGMYFGRIRPFESSSIRDVVTFIVSTSNVLLNQQLSKSELSFVFQIMKFLSTNEPAYTGGDFESVRELRDFTKRAKKYTEMIYSDKGKLEDLDPCDLLQHLNLIGTLEPRPERNHGKQLPEDFFRDVSHMKGKVKRLPEYSKETNKTIDILTNLIIRVGQKTGTVH